MDDLNGCVNDLNRKGNAVIVCITGASSSGKTMISKYLYSKYPFYQYISLGLISKALRYSLSLGRENFEIGSNKFVNKKINEFLYECITYYGEKGVNTIIDGIQCDTEYLSKNPYLSAGIIINTPLETRQKWGMTPQTHFKRNQEKKALENQLVYRDTEKFVIINNGEGVQVCTEIENILVQLLSKFR